MQVSSQVQSSLLLYSLLVYIGSGLGLAPSVWRAARLFSSRFASRLISTCPGLSMRSVWPPLPLVCLSSSLSSESVELSSPSRRWFLFLVGTQVLLVLFFQSL